MTTTHGSRHPASSAFVSARLSGEALEGFPGTLPADIDAAYRVQDESIAAWPDRVAGWKVGGIPEPFRSELSAERLAGPIFSRGVVEASGDRVAMSVFAGGFAAIEAEFVLALGRDVPPGAMGDGAEALRGAVGAVYLGVEIASSPLGAINDLGPLSIISDFGNNAGLVLGAEVDGWRDLDLSSVEVAVDIDGEEAGRACTSAAAPFDALAFLADVSGRRGLTLPRGTLVSTGAITGVHQAGVGAMSTVRFGALGSIDLELVRARS